MSKITYKITGLESYERIDDLCCINANKYNDDFFSASKEYPDENFIKDVYEMSDDLDNIHNHLKALEYIKFRGLSLEHINLIKNSVNHTEYEKAYTKAVEQRYELFKFEVPVPHDIFYILKEVL